MEDFIAVSRGAALQQRGSKVKTSVTHGWAAPTTDVANLQTDLHFLRVMEHSRLHTWTRRQYFYITYDAG
jgi:hypothetical protein